MTQRSRVNEVGNEKLNEQAEALRALVASRSPVRLGSFESSGWRRAPQRFSATNWGSDRSAGRTS